MSERADRRSPRFFRRITDSARFNLLCLFFLLPPLAFLFNFFSASESSPPRHPAGAQGKPVRTRASCYRFGPGRPRLLPPSGPVGEGIEIESSRERYGKVKLLTPVSCDGPEPGRTDAKPRPARVHACMSLRCRPPPTEMAGLAPSLRRHRIREPSGRIRIVSDPRADQS